MELRKPIIEDGAAIHRLVQACPPLEGNSLYAYLLLCRDFSDTCVVAEVDHRILGFVSAYRPPRAPSTLFVWQIAVHERMRGQGLAKRMLHALIARGLAIDAIEATVSPSNLPSQRVFRGIAAELRADCEESPLFPRTLFGEDPHDDEVLFRIGPISRRGEG